MTETRERGLAGEGLERVRHLKRGIEADVLGEAEAQLSNPQAPRNPWSDGSGRFTEAYSRLHEGDKLTIYQHDGKLWARFTDEFRDGRFETIAPASQAAPVAGVEGFVMLPKRATKAMLDAAYAAHDAYEAAETGGWGGLGSVYEAMIAAAPVPPPPGDAERLDLGELERLSAAASPGMALVYMDKHRLRVGPEDSTYVGEFVTVAVTSTCDKASANLAFLAELWNAYRSGKLVHASRPEGTGGGDQTGATPMGSDWSSSTEPKVSALTGDHPSRGEVDYDDLNRLFALMPEGPWHALRTGDSHEIRQIDTDPTNKHHWPFRLCQSIAGQRAACDDAVFAFIAGVLNAWPSIAAANSDDAYIDRVLAMPEDELRKRFIVDGQSPEQAETISRQAFNLAVLKVALTQIHDQYIINRGDLTDAEALGAIEKIAAKALAGEARSAETGTGSVHEHAAPQGATPTPDPVGEAKALLEGLEGPLTPEEQARCLRQWARLNPGNRRCAGAVAHANKIEAALATIRSSQAGEVRDDG